MNLLIKNENSSVCDSLTVDVIKTLQGAFTKDEAATQIGNLIYNKAIIDITAIKDYYVDDSLFNFLDYFGSDKVVLILNNSPLCDSKDFLRKIVKKGYYNFSKNAASISYLVNNPNDYDKVKNIVAGETITSSLNTSDNTPTYNVNKNRNQKVIGITNLTEHAGATTLMYMMLKQLSLNYSVKAIEVNGNDSSYFRNANILYCSDLSDAKIKIKELYREDVILIDLNGFDGNDICDDILYLVEPGIIKINKLIKSGVNFSDFSSKCKFVLNRSVLKTDEINTFEYETRMKVFYNMPIINDRKERLESVDSLLVKLGFKKQTTGGFLGLFK